MSGGGLRWGTTRRPGSEAKAATLQQKSLLFSVIFINNKKITEFPFPKILLTDF